MEYRVVIPEEVFAILEWQDEGLPAICVVNQALANFEPKVVFGWHLSIILTCEQLGDNGMPTLDEKQILDQFGDELDCDLKAEGNALFLARITWNGTRQLLYRVYDPDVANEYLIGIINKKTQVREFDFRMENDDTWKFAKYYLSHWEAEQGAIADGGGM
jgi:hypothetical protein